MSSEERVGSTSSSEVSTQPVSAALDLASNLQADLSTLEEQLLRANPNGLHKSPPLSDSRQPESQALESHEVIELQTFSERKVWIVEKIKVCCPSVVRVEVS